jgi:AbrB family looped-hinge helix DNA binding protein
MTATVSPKGHIAIPKAVRERLNLKAGTEVQIEMQGEAIIVKRVVAKLPHWSTMRGMVKTGPSLTKALEEERAAERAYYDARIKKGR